MQEQEKLTMSVQEAADLMNVSRPTMYRYTEMAGFPLIHVGRKKIIPIQEFKEWVHSQVVRN